MDPNSPLPDPRFARALNGETSSNAAISKWAGAITKDLQANKGASIVIAGEGQVTTTADHPRGAMLRAYDKATGKEVGAVYMPAPQTGSPMTYMVNGKQYIVVAVSGGPYSGEYIAYTLPSNEE